jgi:NTP pyrophosphatase (non-canonical NTP hydrolase)
MDQRYEPKNVDAALGCLVEECGEVLAAVGKAQRWGLASCNPELSIDEQETNRDWIHRELRDLLVAIERAQKFLGPEDGPR